MSETWFQCYDVGELGPIKDAVLEGPRLKCIAGLEVVCAELVAAGLVGQQHAARGVKRSRGDGPSAVSRWTASCGGNASEGGEACSSGGVGRKPNVIFRKVERECVEASDVALEEKERLHIQWSKW